MNVLWKKWVFFSITSGITSRALMRSKLIASVVSSFPGLNEPRAVELPCHTSNSLVYWNEVLASQKRGRQEEMLESKLQIGNLSWPTVAHSGLPGDVERFICVTNSLSISRSSGRISWQSCVPCSTLCVGWTLDLNQIDKDETVEEQERSRLQNQINQLPT